MDNISWALLLLLSFIWGSSFLLISLSLPVFGPSEIVLIRVLAAAITLAPWAWRHWHGQPAKLILSMMALGITNNAIPFALISWGQTGITSGFASMLNASVPLFGIIYAHLLTGDEKMRPNRVAGVVTGFAGVALLMSASLGSPNISFLHAGAIILSANCYSLSTIYAKRFKLPSSLIAFCQVTGASIVTLPFALPALWTSLEMDQDLLIPLLSCLLLGVFGTAIAYLLYFTILRRAGATNIMLATLIVPIMAIYLGVTILGEEITNIQLAGFGVVSLGLLLVDGRILPKNWR